ncbi:MAG TPA: hypothetical protein VN924_31340 [Bryobacteraceae bacterium]|nr:hypothetical protein [Bryobacteraceae bacterium]
MKFAKIVFWGAGAFGVLALAPLYFIFDLVGRQDPPPITHPQFYYGFAGVALAWQFAFFTIATNPARFRPMMIPSLLEKVGYVGALLALHLQGRISTVRAATGLPDALLAVLFLAAFLQTRADRRAATPASQPADSAW